MTIGSVTQKLRPLRIAFLVNPANRADVLQAIQLSSAFWGGTFNPIIPCFKGRLPAIWERDRYLVAPKPRDITDGYLEGFDPDLVVPISNGLEDKYSIGNREVFRTNELMGSMLRSGSADVGIGAIELVQHLAKKEFKYVRTIPASVVLPVFNKSHSLFLSSVFGAWSDDVIGVLKTYYGKQIGLTEPVCSVTNFTTLLAPEHLFPRRINTQEIEYRPRDACVYCLDAGNVLDVLDFWNLRAAGFYVVPAPKQAFNSSQLQLWLKEFIDSNYSEEDGRASSFTTVQVGRSLNEKEVSVFTESLGIEQPKKGGFPKFVTRRWYPRLWDRWARQNTDERFSAFYAGDTETPIDSAKGKVELKAHVPPFTHWGRWSGQPRCVNEISYSVFGSNTPMAEVLPESNKKAAAHLLFTGASRVRLSRSGLVYSLAPHDRRIFFEIPEAQSFMMSWFRAAGWEVEMSSPGLIAAQMIKRLEGKDGIHAIHSERLIKLLDKHASEKVDPANNDAPRATKWIEEKPLSDVIDRIIKEEALHFDKGRYIKRLLEHKILGLGLQLHCPVCLRWMWKSIEHLSAEVECDQCLSRFSVALAPKSEREWSYKPTGPFNVRGFGGGAYPVLFSWLFFSGFNRKSTTPLLSFLAKKGDIDCEVDLALFCEDGGWRAPRNELLLVECKAYDKFKKKDVQRMEKLGAEFPGAILVFSKFDSQLDSTETKVLVAAVNRQRRMWLSQKPHCTIMVLTGTELFSKWGAPECWKDKSGLHADAFKKWSHVDSLTELAEATQQIYLGVPSMHGWAEARLSKRYPHRGKQ